MIVAIVLAAGASRRMGRLKMLLPAGDGATLLSAAVGPLLEAGLSRVVVVLGCEAGQVRRGAGLPEDPRVEIVVNERWREGMSSSLARGLEAFPEAEAALVALGDQPGLTADRVRRVLEAFGPGVAAVAPAEADLPGHPVLFSRELFPELLALTGDVGAREILRRHWGETVRLELPPLPDVDTPEDYRRLGEAGWKASPMRRSE